MRLDSPRVIGVAAAALVLAGWLLGSTLSPPVAQTQSRAAVPPPRATVEPVIAPLRMLSTAAPKVAAPTPTRNPFTFGGGARRTADAPTTPAVAESGESADSASPEAPAVAEPWRLIGMATGADGELTAVIGGVGDVHLLRSGDRVGDVTVAAVTADAVTLERTDGTRIDLRLP